MDQDTSTRQVRPVDGSTEQERALGRRSDPSCHSESCELLSRTVGVSSGLFDSPAIMCFGQNSMYYLDSLGLYQSFHTGTNLVVSTLFDCSL